MDYREIAGLLRRASLTICSTVPATEECKSESLHTRTPQQVICNSANYYPRSGVQSEGSTLVVKIDKWNKGKAILPSPQGMSLTERQDRGCCAVVNKYGLAFHQCCLPFKFEGMR
eukprot:Protomagalhaensia_wolfi_Nauph_80__1060@NODE_1617_length_1441_cov_11_494294_g1252_i0_p1_GENE_NODE_1617_length_1441_cov_11_494294_g1252_i0NODE_1617_length_1441_cov_11_494294_g1252_i0_p1_ORF_typecomplete_len115_score15_51_NODE_1617_length_1441_cov_11_494294_g1252_i0569913